MNESNLAVDPYIISGIEWTLDQKFHFGVEQAKYLEETIEITQNLPINGVSIPFKSDIWDFNPYFKLRSGYNFRFSFEKIPEGFVISAKYFVLMTLLNSDNKVTSINRRYQDVKAFLIKMDTIGVKTPSELTTKDIRNFLDQYIKNHSVKSSSMMKIAIYMYVKYLIANYSYDFKIDIRLFDSYDWMKSAIAKGCEANKTPNIPDDYYNQLLNVLIKVMNDTNASYNYRAVACVYIILSQTGLRITEILALTKNSLKEIEVKDIDKAYFLEVKEFKPASRQQEYVTFRIFANELTVVAFQNLCSLSKERMVKRNTEFIYLPDSKDIPACAYKSRKNFLRLLHKYAPFANVSEPNCSTYNGIGVVKVDISKKKHFFVACPTTKQFRVHVCTELYYSHHVSLLFIQRCMGHLSEEMQGYYVRPKNKSHEEAEERHRLLKDIIQKKVTLLGGKGKEISEQIDQFISEGNFRVEDDLDSLIKFLDGKVAIRVKRSGYCVKATSYRECSRDAKTNEIFCAFDICPNLCHVYYMAADSYQDFKLLQKCFEENDKNGFELQASRELQKLKAVCRHRLIPEMEDMKRKIQLRGLTEVIMDYPQLEPIITNYDDIMKEVDLWTKKYY